MLTFRFSGADGFMVETESLTSGMVGKEVRLEFSQEWDGMTKTAVFRAGAATRVVVGVSGTAVIPAEVLARPLQRLYVGVYGVSRDGRVIPTVRAEGPVILPGVDPSADTSTVPDQPVWAQLQTQIDELKQTVSAPEEDADQDLSGGTAWTPEQIGYLDSLFDCIPWTSAGAGVIADALIASLRSGSTDEESDKALTGIIAAYNGGDVAVGTAVTALTGLVVTAHYSDGSSENVSGYTLSGTIAEGSNTITVRYGGMTTAFTVNGVAGSSGETHNWGIGYFNTSGNVVADVGYLYCEEYLPVSPGDTCYLSNTNRAWKGAWSGWATYDANKNAVGRLNSDAVQAISDNGRCLFTSTVIPDGIAFVRVSTDAAVDAYKDTAVITAEMPEPVLTLADAVWYEGYVAGDGRIESEAGCWYSDLISVEAGAKYRFGNSDPAWSNTWCGIGFYSGITEQFVARVTTAEFTVPDGTKYLRLSAQNMTGCCDTATLHKIS